MSKYFARHPETREYADIIWRRHPAAKHQQLNNVWLVYLNDTYMGEIHRLSSGYSAISVRGHENNWLGEGFGTRWAATQFILRLSGSEERR